VGDAKPNTAARTGYRDQLRLYAKAEIAEREAFFSDGPGAVPRTSGPERPIWAVKGRSCFGRKMEIADTAGVHVLRQVMTLSGRLAVAAKNRTAAPPKISANRPRCTSQEEQYPLRP